MIKDKYLFCKSAGYQYVGYCASCFDMLSKEIAVSSAYFDFLELDSKKRYAMEKKVCYFVEEIVPFFNKYAANAFNIDSVCFVQICFHFDYLSKHLHQSNPLYS